MYVLSISSWVECLNGQRDKIKSCFNIHSHWRIKTGSQELYQKAVACSLWSAWQRTRAL